MASSKPVVIANPNIDISSDEEEDEDSQEEFVPYTKRPEWNDLSPVPQDDGPYSVVSIRYSETFQETYDYFRAVIAKTEISERAFQLTHDCIKLNPSNYTVWHYRRVLLEKLGKNLVEELDYIEGVIAKNQKNYQVWEHYKYVLNEIKRKQSQDELDEQTLRVKQFIRSVLEDDSKNYHAWQQLQWLILDLSKWDGELAFVEKLVADDIRNNSAWNHRFYVIQNTSGFTDEVIESELEYTLKKIMLAPNNESAWNYLMGVIRKADRNIDTFPNVVATCESLYEDAEKRSSYLLGFMVTSFGEKLKALLPTISSDGDTTANMEQFRQVYNQALDYCDQLATKVDTIRKQYWQYQARLLAEKYQNLL
ncbi:hypothetical protein TYRP_008342 [Tyrophagus putrescentiae]|nr:hypothetical protein TYRP_008342 [Tyrophagus putrescentiae]